MSPLAKLSNNQQKLITEGQPVILEIVVKEIKEAGDDWAGFTETHLPSG
jgi:hypothetical protein